MSNFKSKTVEKKETNLLDIITAGATVKAAIDVNDIKSEISELKKIEIQRSKAEEFEREEAKIHRKQQRREQLEHQARVEEDLQRRAEADAEEADYKQRERTLMEIEEIQSLGLGICHDHYKLVKDIAIDRGISRQEAAKSFRDDLIRRGLGALLLNEFIPNDQSVEAIINNYPQLGGDCVMIRFHLREFLASGLTLSEGYAAVLLHRERLEARQKAIKDRQDLDQSMFVESRNVAPEMLKSINVSLDKMNNIEKKVIAHIDDVQWQIDKKILIAHGVIFLLGLTSLTILFFKENWKYGLVMGIIFGLCMNWALNGYLEESKFSKSSFVKPNWLSGCSSKLKSYLAKFGNIVEDIRVDEPSNRSGIMSEEYKAYEAFLENLIEDLNSCSDEAFVFAVLYVLPESSFSYGGHHDILLRDVSSFSKERALYLLGKKPSEPCPYLEPSEPSYSPYLRCATKYGWEFLYLLKQHVPDFVDEYFYDEDELEGFYHEVCKLYSKEVAERLFWIYEYPTYHVEDFSA